RDFTSTNGTAAHLFTESEVGVRICTARVTDDSFLATTKSVTVIVYPPEGGPVPQPPVAIASGWPLIGDAPLETVLSCNSSYDPDGEIVKYEWDFDGDGLSDWQSYQSDHVSHIFDAGIWNVTLRVTDNDGLMATNEITVISNAISLYWQNELVQQLFPGERGDSHLRVGPGYLGVGAAVSPTTGELCVIYAVDDKSLPMYRDERIRMAWKGGAGGDNWRFEDFYIDADMNSVSIPTRPVFLADGTLVFGTFISSPSAWEQAILVTRKPTSEIDIVYAGGFMYDQYYERDWLDVSANAIQHTVGFLYRNGEDGEDYNFAELTGDTLTESNPFADWDEGPFRVGDVRYFDQIPCILQLWNTTSIISKQGEEWLGDLVTTRSVDRAKIGISSSGLSVHYGADKCMYRFFKQGSIWQQNPLLLQEYPQYRGYIEAKSIDQHWCYLSYFFFEDDRLSLLYENGTGYVVEPIADHYLGSAASYCMAVSNEKIYVAEVDSIQLTITLYSRDIPLW
ncbi:MAG: PKD domain-containing protein, partial [bacterium]